MGLPLARTFVYSREPAPMKEPPPQRARVLAFIRAEIAAGRAFPTAQAIAAHMGWKTAAGSYHVVMGLAVEDGQLVRYRDERRVWRFRLREL